jgi:hyaluronate lyase
VENDGVPNNEYIYDSNRNMGMMTQMFHRKPTFSSAISLFSKTTTAFEYINEENKQGFYTGTGMSYLYNGDKRQYLDGYWGSIDMSRLPGTTTDKKMGSLVNDGSWLNSKSWSGGISNGSIGSASMHYSMEKVTKSTLEAKKSWFMLDDRIISLGAGIRSIDSGNVETIVENRKVTNYESAKLYVDGVEVKFGTSQKFLNPKWAYIDTGKLDSSIGYIFPESIGEVIGEFKEESKNWQAVNATNPDQTVSNRFMILAIQHGERPSDQKYQYSIVPNVSIEELKEQVQNQNINILENSPEHQVIEKKDLSLYIGNFQEIGTVGKVTAKTRGSLLIQEKNNGYEIIVSDPMRTNLNVQFSIDLGENLEIGSSDAEIKASKDGNIWTIIADTSGKNGQSKKIFLSKK